MKWAHLSQLPDDVRAVMEMVSSRSEVEDRSLEQVALAAIRAARLASRVPVLCDALLETHPAMSKRKVFDAVALHVGLSEQHVQRIYYSLRKAAS